MSRRTYLSTVAGGVLASGVIGTTSAQSLDDQYGTVVDEGAADDGSESITPVLRDLVDDDTLVEFPPGRYYVDEQVRFTDFRNLGLVVDDGLEVGNVHVVGRHDSGTVGPGRFNVVGSDGSGVVERFRAPGGGQWLSETPNAGNDVIPTWRGPTGILANMTSRTLRFVDCELGGFPDNGLYLKKNTLRGGIEDHGSDGLKLIGNEI